MDLTHYLIPRHLDDPPQLYFWDADEVVLVIFFVMLGLMMGHGVAGAVLGVLARRGYILVKAQGGPGVMMRALYWYTPSSWWMKGSPPSYRREYLG